MTFQQARVNALVDQVTRAQRSVGVDSQVPNKRISVAEIFGENVFSLKVMQERLPKPVFKDFAAQKKGGKQLDKQTADAIAHAVRVWASERGATHFTHIFQPQTGTTAEKHDSFLTFKYGGDEPVAIDTFSGSQLIQAEPDASSFPNGGIRTTFEARGYTVWDTTSPMYVMETAHQTKTLYIPSIFIGYHGEALDEKTVLLRSVEALNKAATKLLRLIGHSDVTNVATTLGTEQEFFFVDREQYVLRNDLKVCGRTLVGVIPAKHQQMEDHYFGRIPGRVLACISEAELELYKLGVPVKTRHNEVAPSQFEMAPIFENMQLAVDHNLLTMDVLHRVAHLHHLKVLYHEKPFAGVNGSGKHCNWSMATNTGINLLEPTATPESNPTFLLFLVATLHAVHKHSALMRLGISTPSNDHRLGGNEAPPSIISAFLGAQLTEVLNSIEEGRPTTKVEDQKRKAVKVGGTELDVMVSTLPKIARDSTDRNRTSPFAFTGNKFEFRAVGSSQSPSFPMTLLNAIVSSSITEITSVLESKCGGKTPSTTDIMAVVKEYIIKTKPIRFEGDGYSAEWHAEAAKRGLPNFANSPEAFRSLKNDEHREVLIKTEVFSAEELDSRLNILSEHYSKTILIEATTLKSIVGTQVLPAAFDARKNIAESCSYLKASGVDAGVEKRYLEKLGAIVGSLETSYQTLSTAIDTVSAMHDDADVAAAKAIIPAMDAVRTSVDQLEGLVSDATWPFPKYTELIITI